MIKNKTSYQNTWILLALGLPIFFACFDIMAIGLGINNISKSFNCSITISQWALSIYMICNAAFTIAAGKLCDRYGAKIIFISGYSIFNLCSIINILSPSIYCLIISRGFQGVGCCMMLISSTSLIHLYFKHNLIKFFGLWSFFVGAGTASGSVLGGILIHYYGWPSIFMINLIFAIVVYWLIYQYLSKSSSSTKNTTKIKLYSIFKNTGILVSLFILLMQIPSLKFSDSLLIIVVFIVFAFYYFYLKVKEKNQYIKNNGFVAGNIAGITSYFSLYSWLLITPLYLEKHYQLDTIHIGFIMLPYFIAFTITPVLIAQFGLNFTKKNLLVSGLLLNMSTTFLLATKLPFSLLDFSILYFLFGMGNSLINTPATSIALEKIPPEQSGVANSILYTTKWIAGALGACIASLLWLDTLHPLTIMYFSAFFSLISIIFALIRLSI